MTRRVSKFLSLFLLGPVLLACETVPTRPAVDASAYLFDLDVEVGSGLSEFDPDVSKGSGDGAARGAGMGFGACILGPLEGSGGGGDPFGALFVIAAGLVISPACALVGGVVGSGMAETEDDVNAWTELLNEAAKALDYPNALTTELSSRLSENPIYAVEGADNVDASAMAIAKPGGAGPAIAPFSGTSDGENMVVVSLDDPDAPSVRTVSTDGAVIEDDVKDSEEIISGEAPITEVPQRVRPSQPNASIYIEISSYGLVGSGIDPKLPLHLSGKLCVTDYVTGEALVSSHLRASTRPKRLEDWAELGQDGLEEQTQNLIGVLSRQVQQAMGRQVKLDYKTSCSRHKS